MLVLNPGVDQQRSPFFPHWQGQCYQSPDAGVTWAATKQGGLYTKDDRSSEPRSGWSKVSQNDK
jgi:hypothetical protein